mmetsp:Transcript_93106/g.267039  ORF Transcript_93106/g.267039 Transcript_93106/m.267039 type:complete len:442 (+) Transcript_93106:274-1599(+)
MVVGARPALNVLSAAAPAVAAGRLLQVNNRLVFVGRVHRIPVCQHPKSPQVCVGRHSLNALVHHRESEREMFDILQSSGVDAQDLVRPRPEKTAHGSATASNGFGVDVQSLAYHASFPMTPPVHPSSEFAEQRLVLHEHGESHTTLTGALLLATQCLRGVAHIFKLQLKQRYALCHGSIHRPPAMPRSACLDPSQARSVPTERVEPWRQAAHAMYKQDEQRDKRPAERQGVEWCGIRQQTPQDLQQLPELQITTNFPLVRAPPDGDAAPQRCRAAARRGRWECGSPSPQAAVWGERARFPAGTMPPTVGARELGACPLRPPRSVPERHRGQPCHRKRDGVNGGRARRRHGHKRLGLLVVGVAGAGPQADEAGDVIVGDSFQEGHPAARNGARKTEGAQVVADVLVHIAETRVAILPRVAPVDGCNSNQDAPGRQVLPQACP